MKAAVSVPDDVFDRAEVLAKRLKLNRSQLFSKALVEFIARHSPDEVTDAIDRVWAEVEDDNAGFVRKAANATLARSEW